MHQVVSCFKRNSGILVSLSVAIGKFSQMQSFNQLRVLVRATHGQFMGSGKPCQLEMGRRLMIWQA